MHHLSKPESKWCSTWRYLQISHILLQWRAALHRTSPNHMFGLKSFSTWKVKALIKTAYINDYNWRKAKIKSMWKIFQTKDCKYSQKVGIVKKKKWMDILRDCCNQLWNQAKLSHWYGKYRNWPEIKAIHHSDMVRETNSQTLRLMCQLLGVHI